MKRTIIILLFALIAAITQAATIYIDPDYAGENGTENGTITRPYNAFTDFTLVSNNTYRLKKGTTYTSPSKILLYKLTNTIVSTYGTGAMPIFVYTGSTNFYAFQFDQCINCSIVGVNIKAPSGTNMVAIIGMGSNTGGFTGGTGITVDSCRIEQAGDDASRDMGIRAGGNQVKILHTTITNISYDGIYAAYCHGIEIAYCNISNVNRRYFTNPDQSDSAGDGIQISYQYDNFHIHHNTIDRTSGGGNKFNLIIGGGTGEVTYTGIIEHNYFINSSIVGTSVYMGPGNGVIIRYNKFMGTTLGLYLAAVASTNTLVHNNIFYNCSEGVRNSYPVAGTKVFNNVFYMVRLYHITVRLNTVEARNNIHIRNGDSGVALHSYGGGSAILSNNCYGDVATVGTFQAAGANSIYGDPEFVDAGNADFHLTDSTSICVNTGIDVGLTYDLDSVAIPQFTTPDIGAYEVESVPITPDPPPVVDPPDTVIVRIPNKIIDINGKPLGINGRVKGFYKTE